MKGLLPCDWLAEKGPEVWKADHRLPEGYGESMPGVKETQGAWDKTAFSFIHRTLQHSLILCFQPPDVWVFHTSNSDTNCLEPAQTP